MRLAPIQRYEYFLHQQKHMSIRQITTLRRQYIMSLPKWIRPLWGYISALPLLLVSLSTPILLDRLIHPLLFPTVFLTLPLAFISFLWGIGPALLMLIISLVGLDIYFIPPAGQFNLFNWWDIAQLLPFFLTSVIIVLITGQRERAYIDCHQDQRELHYYAEELEAVGSHLEEMQRERDGFLLIARHELITPVTALRGYSELLLRRLAKKKLGETNELEAALRRINEQSTRLTTLIDTLLDVNAFRSHGIVLSKERHDLCHLCRKVIDDQRELTGREITFSPSVEPLELQIDRDRMTQVVLNLINNALKYSPPDKPVEIRASRNNQRTTLQVQDHGCGITPDELLYIFEMYYRSPRARSSTTTGLGLGLTISKNIVDQHGGRIWCESELGIGSTFFIELPNE